MIGIPMDIVPEFPVDAQTVLLTEQASFDPAIVSKIKKQLTDGKTVVITSGLLKALQGKGIEDIADLIYTGRTVSTHEFMAERKFVGVKSDSEILLPQITLFTNDAGADIIAYTSGSKTSGDPVLLKTRYSKGLLYVLTIPNAQGDLLCYPQPVLSEIRNVLAKDMFVRLDTPSQVGLYVYDNDKFIVESFRQDPMQAVVIADKRITRLRDLQSGQVLTGSERIGANVFEMPLNSGSYRVFSAE
jgi:hypothetical protein